MFNQNEGLLEAHDENVQKPVLIYPMGQKKIPLFLEFLFAITRILVIVIAVLVAILSILAKASYLDIVIRVGICIFSLGLVGFIINWIVGKQYIKSAVAELVEIENKNKERGNSIQFEA
jgi:hypothetical protein